MRIDIEKGIRAIQAKNSHTIPVKEIENISVDSRSLQNHDKTLFFALVGQNHDGHGYIYELIQKGVFNFVVQQIPEGIEEPVNFFLVENTTIALQKFAIYYRNLYSLPVIGIAGSNGKTIVKEWLNFLLSPEYHIIRSPKSYNSQIGVPLSVMNINEKHNLGIFEAGISTVNEMSNLESIIQPSIGIFTSIGSAHEEGFIDRIQKINEKLLLFKNVIVLIYHKEEILDNSIATTDFLRDKKRITWSFKDKSASILVSKKRGDAEGTSLQIHFQNEFVNYQRSVDACKSKNFEISIPFSDQASIENALHCFCVLLYLGYDLSIIKNRMKELYPIEMRLKIKKGINNITIIDDSYSCDYQSLKIALDFLENQKKGLQKTVILSDIVQSGLSQEELYQSVSKVLESNRVDRIIGIGKTISQFSSYFKNSSVYENTEAFIKEMDHVVFENETVLIKGARSFYFEKIVSLLEEKTHETVLEINLNAITHNLNYFKSKLNPSTKLMVMVKAFGYGAGSSEIAKLLEYHNVAYLGVAFVDEGVVLRNAGIKMPIMVLNPENSSFINMIAHQLEPEIYNFKGLQAFLKIAQNKGLKRYPIHIKIDTGMHRLGFEEKNINALITMLIENPFFEIKSIFSHLASSDEQKHSVFTKNQIALFERLSTKLMVSLNLKSLRHILNTSGISNFTDNQFDMVRLGVGLYGISNDNEETKQLQYVGTLKSVLSQIKTIAPGDSIGYNRQFITKKTMKSATIPIGYADGIRRSWGNGIGYVMIHGQKATILGNICMDMLMVDVSEIDCKEGDSVTIFGENPTVSQIAQKVGTIPYEILTGISSRVKRVFYRE